MNKPIGLILAGGQSSRMGGNDKGLITLDGKLLITLVIERFSPQVGQLLINANRNAGAYQNLGFPVISDSLTGFQGPLSGILAALEYLQQNPTFTPVNNQELLITPVDSPRLPLDLYARLSNHKEAITKTPRPISIAHDGRRQQSLFMLIPIPDNECLLGYLDSLRHTLKQGQRSVQTWLEQQHSICVDFSDEADCFININSQNDLDAYARQTHAE